MSYLKNNGFTLNSYIPKTFSILEPRFRIDILKELLEFKVLKIIDKTIILDKLYDFQSRDINMLELLILMNIIIKTII